MSKNKNKRPPILCSCNNEVINYIDDVDETGLFTIEGVLNKDGTLAIMGKSDE